LISIKIIPKDGCLSGNPCGDGECISTSAKTFTCECPAGYDGFGCLGILFAFIFFLFTL